MEIANGSGVPRCAHDGCPDAATFVFVLTVPAIGEMTSRSCIRHFRADLHNLPDVIADELERRGRPSSVLLPDGGRAKVSTSDEDLEWLRGERT